MPADPIIIVGAGPGGLVTALALSHIGLPVLVLERSSTIRAVGAGLTLQVNAMRMLAALDLDEQVAALGEPLVKASVETEDGRGLSRLCWDDASQDTHGVAVHRGALSRMLADELPEGALRCGCEFVGFEQDESGVRVELGNGAWLRGQALIGADGIHSRVRLALFGERALRYAGYTCWRGIALEGRPLGPGHTAERWGAGQRFGIVPINANETYWFATENTPRNGRDAPDPRRELLERFATFAEPVRTLIESTPADAILRNDIIDLDPLSVWSDRRATLVGDAAHAMTPNMGQGACQAIEDGIVLAHALAGAESIENGLADYERRRISRARSLVTRSRKIGRIGQWENGLARAFRNTVARLTPTSVMSKALDAAWQVEVPSLRGASQ